MLHGSSGPGIAGSELIPLLSGLARAPAAAARPAFAARLGGWLDWTGAIALAEALGAAAPAPATAIALAEVEADCARLRAALEAAIDRAAPAPTGADADFGPYRRHCRACQQAMQEGIAALRRRLRGALAQRTPALARLAAIDAVLERALAARERELLARVPLLLQAHFERLQGAAGAPGEHRQAYIDEQRRVLRAELEHRMLPARGLLDTLLLSEST
ncbi:MAG: DUF3348 family protein [Burkholderiales bacterium]|nr:DUF3348 family protein [Burkholderiales bacterium]MDE2160074.1 DUF3348 family protein [Burkholderiales bacterium]